MAFNNPLAGRNLVKNATTSVFTIKGASPVSGNAQAHTQLTNVNDLVVVVIKKREAPDLHYSDEYMDTPAQIDDIVNQVYERQIKLDSAKAEMYRKEQKKFNMKDHRYTFTEDCANVFLPCAFHAPSTIRKFDRNGNINKEQEKNNDMVAQLQFYGQKAIKLAFMIQFGNDAAHKYKEYTDEWKINGEKLKENKNSNHYLYVVRKSLYNLWGQYNGYYKGNKLGFHRGIDTLSAYNQNVHAIYSGTVVEIGGTAGGYISIHTDELNGKGGATITYMHHKFNQTRKQGDWVEAGELLGTQAGYSMKGVANEYPSHTHVEFNLRKYLLYNNDGRDFNRPYADILDVKLEDFSSGKNFSLNPYFLLEQIWFRRFFSNPHDNPQVGR